jgi:hypothetical protein
VNDRVTRVVSLCALGAAFLALVFSVFAFVAASSHEEQLRRLADTIESAMPRVRALPLSPPPPELDPDPE